MVMAGCGDTHSRQRGKYDTLSNDCYSNLAMLCILGAVVMLGVIFYHYMQKTTGPSTRLRSCAQSLFLGLLLGVAVISSLPL